MSLILSPRIKILALVGIAVGCFLIREPAILATVFTLHIATWFWCQLPLSALVRLVKKLSFFMVMIVLAFALFPPDNPPFEAGHWEIFGMSIPMTGVLAGIMMALRMLTVIVASQIMQMTSKAGEFVAGLRGIMIPEVAAMTIDSTLYLLGPEAGQRGKGQGGGMGGGGHRKEADAGTAPSPGVFSLASIKRLKNGDFGFLVEMIENALTRSKSYISQQQRGLGRRIDPQVIHDVSIISGLCLLMMTTKLLKVLPGVPFAPGYKIVFLVPLYILAAELTRTRFGATITGTTVGVISFLFGDGRFGIFEILKHITPGLVVDLAAPLTRRWMAKPSKATFIVLGAVCALARATTMLAVVFFVSGNALLFATVGAAAVSQVFFGALSGFVTFYLITRLGRLKSAAALAPVSETSTVELPHEEPSTAQQAADADAQSGSDGTAGPAPTQAGGGGRGGRGDGSGGGRGRGKQKDDSTLIKTK